MKTPEGFVPLADYLALREENEGMKNLILSLLKRVEELEAQINKNSNNSSKPPSRDGLKKKTKNNREKSNRKQGAQPGHKGSGLVAVENPDEIISCKVEKTTCEWGLDLRNVKPEREEKRQVIDIAQVLTKVVEYLVEVKKCKCGKEHKGVCDLTGRVQYGNKPKKFIRA